MASIKVLPPTSSNLCNSCTWSHVREYENGSTFIHCSEIKKPVLHKVVKCKDYQDSQKGATLGNMEKIAWEVKADKYGNPMGFKPPNKGKDWKD